MNTNKNWRPQALVLSPRGEKGFLQLGALAYLDGKHFLTDVKTICGCSVGSIIGLLYASGCKPTEIIDHASKINI